tara:strand:- start:106 stop:249 length:144 start_codon:yes stop_codon:yes gene_type:complete
MPNVNGKSYPYTKAGMKAASVAKKKKTVKKKKVKKAKKVSMKKGMIG